MINKNNKVKEKASRIESYTVYTRISNMNNYFKILSY